MPSQLSLTLQIINFYLSADLISSVSMIQISLHPADNILHNFQNLLYNILFQVLVLTFKQKLSLPAYQANLEVDFLIVIYN